MLVAAPASRFLGAFLSALILAAVPLAAVAQPLQPGEIEVGFGTADITPPVGVPLAGYSNRRLPPTQWLAGHAHATFFRPSTGIHDPVAARAMALVRGADRLVFVRLDLVAVSATLTAEIARRVADLGLGPQQLVIAATHTHSGPGAWIDSKVWAMIGTDQFQPAVFEHIAAGAAQAVRRAMATLAPARLFATAFSVPDIQRNRRAQNGPVDPTASLFMARGRDGGWLGGLINFAIHPVALPPENLEFSADLTGAFEDELSARLAGGGRRGTFLFVNGALGDVSPIGRRFTGIARMADAFAGHAVQAVTEARPVDGQWTMQVATVDLGAPHVTLRNCIRQTWLRPIMGRGARIPLGEVVTRQASLAAIRFGDITMMIWPGEPTSALGFQLKEAAKAAGSTQPMVLAVAGDYKAYFTTPEEFGRRSYESCMSWFGPDGGEKIVRGYRQLLGALPH